MTGISTGGLIAFMLLGTRVAGPLIGLAKLIQDIEDVRSSVQQVGEVLNNPTETAATRAGLRPLLEGAIQPSSVALHVDRYSRFFRNDTTPYIDPKRPQEDLTELVEVDDYGAFILHQGEFVLGSTL